MRGAIIRIRFAGVHAGCRSELLAAEGDGLEQALLEAATLLGEGAPGVLLIVAEEAPPELYTPFIDDVPFPYAVALLLRPGAQWQLQLGEGQGPRSTWPHALELVRALCGDADSLQHHWKRRQWNWSRIKA